MDSNLFNNNNSKTNLIYMKGKAWSSLQNIIDLDDLEESESALNENANGYLSPINGLTNGEFNDQYTKIKFNSFKSNLTSDTSKLSKEDMDLYGYRPAWDQFYLVVCEQCKQVIKPQALQKHYDLRHKETTNNLNQFTLNRRNFLEIKNENNNDSNLNSLDGNSNLRNVLSSRNLLTKDDIDLERMKNNKSNDVKLKASFRNINNKSNNSTASSSMSNNNETITVKKSTRAKLLPCKDRKYDPDKHCGVRLTEQDSPCTRSLTCKTHSLTLRRSVLGRSKLFDDLLSEHRLAKEASLRAAGIEIKPTKLQLKQQQRLQKNKDMLNKETQMISSPIHVKLFQSPIQSSLNNSNIKSQQSNSPTSLSTHVNNNNNNLIINNYNSSPASTNLHIQSPTAVIKNFNKLSSNLSPNQNIKNNQHLEKLLQTPPQHISKEFNSIANNFNKNSTNTTSPVPQMQPISQIRFHHLNYQNHISKPKLNESTSYPTFSKNLLSCSPKANNFSNMNCDSKQYNCDKNNLKNTSLNHYPKPAAFCTFNARHLCIQSETPNGVNEILSSQVFNRKQDFTYSALSVFCKRESTLTNINNETNEKNSHILTPKTNEHVSNSIQLNSESKVQNLDSIETYHISSNNSFSNNNNLIDEDFNLINSQSDSNHSISGTVNRNEDIKIKPNNFINFDNIDSNISYKNPLVNEISKNNIVNTYSNNLFSLK